MTAHASSAVLVGRDADLAALHDALKRTRSGEPSTVLVGGEAGVGKTRLVEEFRRAAAEAGALVLTGQCLELGEEGLPLAPFAAALRELVHRDGPAVFEGHERDFARLLPELGPPSDAGGEARRGYLFELVASLFGRLSEGRPLVLVLEDLHWADRSTRDLIGFLVRSARLPYVLLLATYRTDELHRGHPLRSFLAELDRVRGVQRQDLDRLDFDGTAELLTHLLGAEPEPRTVDHVHERAQGNPFFIEQFAATGDEASCCDIPESLRDLLLARVDRLPEPAQAILRVAAVGGTRFGHDLLARVAGVPDADLETALRAAVAAQLIVVDPGGGYEFRHALVREAVHDDLLPGEHSRLHARYAAAIEAEPQLVPMGRAPAETAHHWHAAQDHPRALVAARRAADDAGRRYAYAEQARLLERALALWEQVPDAAELLGTCHLDLLEETALVAIDSGDLQRALTLTRAALADLDAAAEPLRAGRLLIRRAKLLRIAGLSDGAAECREAYRLLSSAPVGPEQVELLADVAYALATVDTDEGDRVAQEVLAAAESLGDVSTRVSATIMHSRVCGQRVSAPEGVVLMREAAAQARAADDLPNLARAQVNISDTLFELGRYAESADAAAEGVPAADRAGVSRTTGVFLLANQAEALLALGRWDEADARCAEAARQDPPGTLALPWLRLRAWLRLARGQDGAEPLVTRAVSYLGKPYLQAVDRLALSELHVRAALCAADGATVTGGDASGEIAAAVSAASRGVAEPSLTGIPRYGWPLLAVAAAAAVRDPAATDLRRRIAELAAATPQPYPADRAYAAQVAAVLGSDGLGGDGLGGDGLGGDGLGGDGLGGDGVGGDDPGRWRAAVAAWRADGQPYRLAAALLGLATAVAGAGDRAAAAEAIAESEALAGGLGAAPLADAAATLARRLGVRPSRAAYPAELRKGTDGLTAREREVLRLVAEGQSNSRIAQRLYISPKTASVHVSRIIAKLAVSNRLEAAAVAQRLGLLDGD